MFTGHLNVLAVNLVFRVLLVKPQYFHFFHLLITLSVTIANVIFPMNIARLGHIKI